MSILSGFLFPLALFSCPPPATAPAIPIDSSIYEDLDFIHGYGGLKNAIYGVRPWSEHEVWNFLNSEKISRQKVLPAIERVKQKLDRPEYCETNPIFFRDTRLSFGFTNDERTSPLNNGVGQADAVYQPLAAYNEGLRSPDSEMLSFDTGIWIPTQSWGSVTARPVILFERRKHAPNHPEANFRTLSFQTGFSNLRFTIGREPLQVGQKKFGGLFLSNNARSLDMIRLSSRESFQLPGFLSRLGYWKADVSLGTKGPGRHRSNTWVYIYNLSWKPAQRFELNFSQLMEFGGRGARDPKWYRVPLEGAFIDRHNSANNAWMDQKMALSARLQIWRAEIYADTFFDDFWSKTLSGTGQFVDFWREKTASTLGIYFPSLGAWSLRAEYTRIPAEIFSHNFYKDGHTLDRFWMGDSLGRDAKEYLLELHYRVNPQLRVGGLLTYRQRSNDLYIQNVTSDSYRNSVVTNRPDETAIGIEPIVSYEWAKDFELRYRLGVERAENANFQAAKTEWFYASQLDLIRFQF